MVKDMLLPFVGGVDAARQTMRPRKVVRQAAAAYDRLHLVCLCRPMHERCSCFTAAAASMLCTVVRLLSNTDFPNVNDSVPVCIATISTVRGLNLRCLSAGTEGKHSRRAHDKLADVLRQSEMVLLRVVDKSC